MFGKFHGGLWRTAKKSKAVGQAKPLLVDGKSYKYVVKKNPKGYPWVDLFETVQLETWRWINVCVCAFWLLFPVRRQPKVTKIAVSGST